MMPSGVKVYLAIADGTSPASHCPAVMWDRRQASHGSGFA
jgi:hypothetical protein